MSSSTLNINANIDSVAMPSPPPYEVLKLQWQIKQLRRMLRTAEQSLAGLNGPRPDFIEPLSMSPVVSSPRISLARAPANHIFIDGEWVHQDSEAARSAMAETVPLPPSPEMTATPAPSPSDNQSDSNSSQSSSRKKLHIRWNKVMMTLASEEEIRSIIHDIDQGTLSSGTSFSWKGNKHFPDSPVNSFILDSFRRLGRSHTLESLTNDIKTVSDQFDLVKGDDAELKNHLRELVHQGILRV